MTQTKEILFAYLGLLTLLFATILTSFLNLGAWNDILALVFALGKSLIILYCFMHFRKFATSERILFLVGLLTLLLLIVGVLDDVLLRTLGSFSF